MQALDIFTESEIHKFVFCKISVYTYRLSCGFVSFYTMFAKILFKIHDSKPLLSFLSSTYHCTKVRKHFTKQEKKYIQEIFLRYLLWPSSSTGHYYLKFLPVDLLGLNECLAV